jgi:hypothetical protein
MTIHAMEEMAEDDLDILDIEEAVLNGRVVRIHREDPQGTKYIVEGLALNGRKVVAIVGRFMSTGKFLVITVYEIHEEH